jgi:hypothetical protein
MNKQFDFYKAIDFIYDQIWLPQDEKVLNVWFDRVVGIEFDYQNTFISISENERICTIQRYLQHPDIRIWDNSGYSKIDETSMLLIGFNTDEEKEFIDINNSTEFHQWILNSSKTSGNYKIIDNQGIELPKHYSGRYRTYEEAKKMVDNLNIHGEYKTYTMVKV